MKIFLSSTAYDLKDLRALIVSILESRGHEVLYHESPTFPAKLGLHSHDQCILAVDTCELVLCLIDTRYGGRYAGSFKDRFTNQKIRVKGLDRGGKKKTFNVTVDAKDLSITWCELITAYSENKYVITFARQSTLDEKETRRANQHLATFRPAFAERNELFDLLDWITKQNSSNWVASFNTIVDLKEKIEKWIDELEKTIIPDSQPSLIPGERKKIAIIVEGEFDQYYINKLISSQEIDAEFSIIPLYSKDIILNEFKIKANHYLDAFNYIFVVIDSDAKTKTGIGNFKNRLLSLLTTKQRSKVNFVLANPTIYSWILAGLNPEMYKRYNGRIDKSLFKHSINSGNMNYIKELIDVNYDINTAIDLDKDLRNFIASLKRVLKKQTEKLSR